MRILVVPALALIWLTGTAAVPVAPPAAVVSVVLAGFVPGPDDHGPVRVAQGGRLLLLNADYPGEQQEHDIVHAAEVPLFWSPTVRSGQWAEVEGVERLPSGTYTFRCSVHPATMLGTLEVTGA
ncbi:MAG TPA: hypothetical protein VM840_12715 [Actinomycetota bacterium]|nr:hypothetical protein [Actinomycetota bacterium]